MTKHPTNHPAMPLSVFLIIAVVAGFSSCGILSSDDPPELEPGPRNYEWSIDSVYSAPGGWMNTIWGSSPDDVWIGSSGGSDRLWHYNGVEWKPYSEHIPRSIYTIFGLSQNNAWMGTNGIIYHYDGYEWTPFYTYSPKGMGEPIILDIWGTSSSDVYAVGTVATGQNNPSYKGFILYYNGNTWSELLMTDFGMQFQRIRKNEEGVYLYGSGPYSQQTIPDSTTIYSYDNRFLKELISIPRGGSENRLWLNRVGNKILILNNKKLQRYSNGNYKSIAEFPETNIVYSFFGRHEKDIFLVTSDGLMHYNGIEMKLLFKTGAQPSIVLLEKDVFFFKNDYESGTNVIYHGTLTDEEEESSN